MKKSYSLALIGPKILPINKTCSSSSMIFNGLVTRLSKLEHVKLHVLAPKSFNSGADVFFKEMTEIDFILIHMRTMGSLVQNIKKAKPKVKYQVCSIIEVPQRGMDYCFGFLKSKKPHCHIPFPYNREFMINLPKELKTVLLDEFYTDRGAMRKKLIAWLEPLVNEGFKFYQLTNKSTVAKFIEPFIKCPYQEYMEKSSRMESFIQTHPGSYEHSVLDMVGRGIRTLIPTDQIEFRSRGTFISREIVEGLDLLTFSNGEMLRNLLRAPVDIVEWNFKICRMTEYDEVVRIVDDHFQEVLSP